MLGGSAAWGAPLALFGMSPHPWAGLAFLVLIGAADTVSVVSRSTIVQMHTPSELLGRVSAAEQIVGQAGPDIGNMRGFPGKHLIRPVLQRHRIEKPGHR
ncbi:hypothetical protein ACTWPT_06925 [Nonomuraea sp. 3N208]|uniref:hypothetical protein n=1 Tax=Nonomuraea sp. 3N208 TaxID=3457421 RepID=UPI003FCECEFE